MIMRGEYVVILTLITLSQQHIFFLVFNFFVFHSAFHMPKFSCTQKTRNNQTSKTKANEKTCLPDEIKFMPIQQDFFFFGFRYRNSLIIFFCFILISCTFCSSSFHFLVYSVQLCTIRKRL